MSYETQWVSADDSRRYLSDIKELLNRTSDDPSKADGQPTTQTLAKAVYFHALRMTARVRHLQRFPAPPPEASAAMERLRLATDRTVEALSIAFNSNEGLAAELTIANSRVMASLGTMIEAARRVLEPHDKHADA